MASETETKTGVCPAHGRVEGRREIPGMGFPFVVFAILRSRARRKPFTCPECDAPITSD